VTTVPLTDPLNTFQLTVTLDGCESANPDEVTVTVGDALYATATADPISVCPGSSTMLTVTATGGEGTLVYEWQPQNLIAGDNTLQEVTTTALGTEQTFEVTVTDEAGATYTADVTVTMKPVPIADAGVDQNVPYGGTATLEAADAGVDAEYHWTPADKIDGDPNQRIVTTVPLTDPLNTFQLTVTLDGCESANPDEVTVTVGDALYATATADPTSVCYGENTTLTVTATGGTGSYTYEWEPQNLIAGDNTSPMVTTTVIDADRQFTCTVTDDEGATFTTVPVMVTVKPLPTADAGEDQTIPFNTAATLTAADAGEGATYLWEPEYLIAEGQGTRTLLTKPLIAPQQFYLTVTKGGCQNNAWVNIDFCDNFEALIEGPTSLCPGNTITLTAKPDGMTYLWSTGEVTQSIRVSPTVETKYTVTVTSSDGCEYDADHNVEIVDHLETSIVGPNMSCVNGSVTLTAYPEGMEYEYEWKENDVVISTEPSITVTAVDTATYTVTVTSASCDGTASHELIVIDPDIRILGYTDIFFASDIWHGIYHYYVVDSLAIPLAPIDWMCSNPDWILLPISDYQCKLIATTEASCVLTAHTLVAENCDEVMSIEIKATEYTEETEIALFPNPVKSEVTVQAPGMIHIRMYDSMGQKVMDIPLHKDTAVINMEKMARGVYMVEITTINDVIVKKLILSK
jgi:hypothetical protein